jgi:hypothetical protein
MSKKSDFTILGAFITKTLKNTSVSLAMSVCLSVYPSVRSQEPKNGWTDVHDIWYWRIPLTVVDRFRFSLRSGMKTDNRFCRKWLAAKSQTTLITMVIFYHDHFGYYGYMRNSSVGNP